eukprot:gene4791-5041_t
MLIRYFTTYQLLLLNGTDYPNSSLETVRVAGWHLRWVNVPKPLPHKLYALIQLWAMHEYHEVVFMEPMAVFVGPLTGPFTSPAAHPSKCGVWAGRMFANGTWQPQLDTAVMGIRPNVEQYLHLHLLLQSYVAAGSADMADTQVLQQAFNITDRPTWCDLEPEKNMPAGAFLQNHTEWELVSQKQVVHFDDIWPWNCTADLQPVCSIWAEENISQSWPVTVVSAFYRGPNKYVEGSYDNWGRAFLRQKVPLVLITNNASAIPALSLRDPHMTRVLEVKMEDFFVSQQTYDTHWEEQHAVNPERNIHSIFLYKVWLEKTNHVLRAIDLNPFNSSHYVWVDFGSFRDEPVWGERWTVHRERFPTQNRLLMLTAPMNHPTKFLGGGIIGGSVRAWEQWSLAFYNRLSLELRAGKHFVGDDQILMTMVAKDHPRLVCVVKQTGLNKDPWFYLQDYLAGSVPVETACSKHQTDSHHLLPFRYEQTD